MKRFLNFIFIALLGYFTFVLHTHLPYVLHHGKWPFGTDWLSEAVSECYLPILGVLENLQANGRHAKLSMDFSPVLLEQLAHPDFLQVFSDYCEEKITLAKADSISFKHENQIHLATLADYWKSFYEDANERFFQHYQGDLIGAFKKFSDSGMLDAMTCGATHGYFPLLLDDRNIRAQIQTAINTHEKYFGKTPRGIWLPECAYRPRYWWSPQTGNGTLKDFSKERAGIEELLSEYGLEYFVVEGTLTKGGKTMSSFYELSSHFYRKHMQLPDWKQFEFLQKEHDDRSLADIYAVKSTMHDLPGAAPVVFSRDRRTSEQVWSGDIGYPGNEVYLDFHKRHHDSGLRYWKVTGHKVDIGSKEQYYPEDTDAVSAMQARHFIGLVKETLLEHGMSKGRPGVVCSPFDTELFGHWWFEGPSFLEKVLELLSSDQDIILSNCAEIVDRVPEKDTIALPEGSWGEGGGHYVWLNQSVTWTWKEIYALEKRFLDILNLYRKASSTSSVEEILKQAARELLLLESSDWQFLITTESAADYSQKRFEQHANALVRLLEMAENAIQDKTPVKTDQQFLKEITTMDNLFKDIDLHWWE